MNMKMNVDLTYYSRVIMDGEEDDDDGMEQRTDMHSNKKQYFCSRGLVDPAEHYFSIREDKLGWWFMGMIKRGF